MAPGQTLNDPGPILRVHPPISDSRFDPPAQGRPEGDPRVGEGRNRRRGATVSVAFASLGFRPSRSGDPERCDRDTDPPLPAFEAVRGAHRSGRASPGNEPGSRSGNIPMKKAARPVNAPPPRERAAVEWRHVRRRRRRRAPTTPRRPPRRVPERPPPLRPGASERPRGPLRAEAAVPVAEQPWVEGEPSIHDEGRRSPNSRPRARARSRSAVVHRRNTRSSTKGIRIEPCTHTTAPPPAATS